MALESAITPPSSSSRAGDHTGGIERQISPIPDPKPAVLSAQTATPFRPAQSGLYGRMATGADGAEWASVNPVGDADDTTRFSPLSETRQRAKL